MTIRSLRVKKNTTVWASKLGWHRFACMNWLALNKLTLIKKSVQGTSLSTRVPTQILSWHILVFLWIIDTWKMQYSKICRNVQYFQSAPHSVSIFNYICRWQTDKKSKWMTWAERTVTLNPTPIKGRHTKWYILTFPVSLDASKDP